MSSATQQTSAEGNADQPPPLHLCLFCLTLLALLGLSWYLSYQSAAESMAEQARLGLVLLPLGLVMAVHWLSSADGRWVPFFLRLPDRDFVHRAGGSPWGLTLLLSALLFVASRKSFFTEKWSPLVN